jgi:UrcA family protein
MASWEFSDMARAPLFGTIIMIVGSVALLSASQPVLAAGEGQVRSARVSIAGVDLGTPRGRHEIGARIERAARRVCGSRGLEQVRAHVARRACIEAAVARGRVQVAGIIAARPVMAAASPRSPSATSPEEHFVL